MIEEVEKQNKKAWWNSKTADKIIQKLVIRNDGIQILPHISSVALNKSFTSLSSFIKQVACTVICSHLSGLHILKFKCAKNSPSLE